MAKYKRFVLPPGPGDRRKVLGPDGKTIIGDLQPLTAWGEYSVAMKCHIKECPSKCSRTRGWKWKSIPDEPVEVVDLFLVKWLHAGVGYKGRHAGMPRD